MRPICINHGCNSGVSVMAGSIHDSNPRWRVHCGHCQAASYGKWPHRAGVTPFKTGKCSNTDGHLGFYCSINWKKIPSWANGMTEVDHSDGDFSNIIIIQDVTELNYQSDTKAKNGLMLAINLRLCLDHEFTRIT